MWIIFTPSPPSVMVTCHGACAVTIPGNGNMIRLSHT